MDQQTRDWYLRAMGIPLWMPRELLVPDAVVEQPASGASEVALLGSTNRVATPVAGDTLTHLPKQVAEQKTEPQRTQQTARPPAKPERPELSRQPEDSSIPVVPVTPINDTPVHDFDWLTLEQSVQACQRCALHKTRTKTVFGSGQQTAQWMIIGEAPGAEEDRQGLPFVGRAGQLLTNMLRAAGLQREQVYITNTLKCRPPHNRDPVPEESAACYPYLQRQLALVKPALLIAVGRIAAHNILQTKEPLGRLRDKLHRVPDTDIPLLVTYHPAYLLRRPSEKAKAWQDLQLALNSHPPVNAMNDKDGHGGLTGA